jgi:Type VI secretion system (T6SS), amidase effector protein 4
LPGRRRRNQKPSCAHGIDKNRVSMSQFKKETHLNPAITLSLRTSKNNKNAKEAQSPPDFVIDTLAIKKYISETNKTTYSFRIYPLTAPAQPNEYYNLVYRKVNNGWETSIFYLKKLPKRNSENKLFEKIELLHEGTVFKTTTSKTAYFDMCAYEVPTVQCNGSCKTGVCDGFGCSTGECIVNEVRYGVCATGGGSGGGTTDPSSNYGSGGGTTDPYSYDPNTYDNPVYDDPEYLNRINRERIWTALYQAQIFFAKDENIGFFNETVKYQQDNQWSAESLVLGNFAREYKQLNPEITWQQFQNWFMGSPEGNDGGEIYDPTDYIGINVGKQNLPGRNAFYDAFPKVGASGMTSDLVYELVGGHMWEAHKGNDKNYQNACAIRVSRALNYSGKPIPVFINNKGKQKTEKGKDGLNYILDASSLLAYMLKAFPDTPPVHLKNKTPDEYQKALNGKWGIYIMVPKIGFGASGHADFYSQSGCLSRCYFSDAAEIYFWELK